MKAKKFVLLTSNQLRDKNPQEAKKHTAKQIKLAAKQNELTPHKENFSKTNSANSLGAGYVREFYVDNPNEFPSFMVSNVR